MACKNAVVCRDGGTLVLRITDENAVVVDDEPDVLEFVRTHKICLWRRPKKDAYPCFWLRGKRVALHRVLANAPDGLCVHHRDGNGFNCCRDNLVIKTRVKLLRDSKRMLSPLTGIHKRKKGYRASWIDENTGKRRYKTYPFSKFPGHQSYDKATRKIQKKTAMPKYPRYYLDPSPIKS